MESEIEQLPRRNTPIYILDGGLGTTLKDEYNIEVDGEARPLWSSHLLISEPAKVLEVQRAFADAGAEVIITATYQASFEGFARTRDPQSGKLGIPENEAVEYMRSAVSISRHSFGDSETSGKVALSLGAYGAIMIPGQEYTGLYDHLHRTAEQLAEWHGRRLDVFTLNDNTWSNVDLIAFETIPLLAEIDAARMTLERAFNSERGSAAKPFWISCVFPGEDLCLPDGSSVDMVVDAMLKGAVGARPHGIGLNCTKTSKVPALLEQFGKAIERLLVEKEIPEWPALVLYPDGTRGEVYNTTTQKWEKKGGGMGDSVREPSCQCTTGYSNLITNYPQISWEEQMLQIVDQTKAKHPWAAIYIGGCCKTTPKMIESLTRQAAALKNLEADKVATL